MTKQILLVGITSVGISLLLLPIAMLYVYRFDPAHYAYRQDYHSANDFLVDNIQADDLIIVDSYLSDFWYFFFNFSTADNSWYSLPTSNNIKMNSLRQIIESQGTLDQTFWLVAPTDNAFGWPGYGEQQLIYFEEEMSWTHIGSNKGITVYRIQLVSDN